MSVTKDQFSEVVLKEAQACKEAWQEYYMGKFTKTYALNKMQGWDDLIAYSFTPEGNEATITVDGGFPTTVDLDTADLDEVSEVVSQYFSYPEEI